MSTHKTYITSLLMRLSSEPKVGGLFITNQDIRYALVSEKGLQKYSVPLDEGVIKDGVMREKAEFEKALGRLHELIAPKKSEEILKVVTSLPPGLIYSQSFKVPYAGEEKLAESARLNLQIITPIKTEEAYMSWQKIKDLESDVELLGAFVERAPVESIKNALESAYFYPAAFEFPALSLTRLLKAYGREEVTMFVYVGNDGMDFFMTKSGALYFDYFTSWTEVQDFRAALEQEARKVANFALSRAGKEVERVLVIAPGVEEDVTALLREKLGIKTELVSLKGDAAGPLWYIPRGAAGRKVEEREEHELNIGAEGLKKAFFEERLVRFVKLWRNIGFMVLGIFLVIDGGGATLLATKARNLEAQVEGITKGAGGMEEVRIEKNIATFNALVDAAEGVRKGDKNWYAFLVNLRNITQQEGIRMTRTEVDPRTKRVTLGAEGENHEAVIGLKNILEAEPGIEDVDLPLSRISVTSGNNVSFTLSFVIKEG